MTSVSGKEVSSAGSYCVGTAAGGRGVVVGFEGSLEGLGASHVYSR